MLCFQIVLIPSLNLREVALKNAITTKVTKHVVPPSVTYRLRNDYLPPCIKFYCYISEERKSFINTTIRKYLSLEFVDKLNKSLQFV